MPITRLRGNSSLFRKLTHISVLHTMWTTCLAHENRWRDGRETEGALEWQGICNKATWRISSSVVVVGYIGYSACCPSRLKSALNRMRKTLEPYIDEVLAVGGVFHFFHGAFYSGKVGYSSLYRTPGVFPRWMYWSCD